MAFSMSDKRFELYPNFNCVQIYVQMAFCSAAKELVGLNWLIVHCND